MDDCFVWRKQTFGDHEWNAMQQQGTQTNSLNCSFCYCWCMPETRWDVKNEDKQGQPTFGFNSIFPPPSHCPIQWWCCLFDNLLRSSGAMKNTKSWERRYSTVFDDKFTIRPKYSTAKKYALFAQPYVTYRGRHGSGHTLHWRAREEKATPDTTKRACRASTSGAQFQCLVHPRWL